ncbi:MAG: hypothetical protein J6Y16_00570 [Treponema sp.]|nr:hypothetical protein [Treponema sp.]
MKTLFSGLTATMVITFCIFTFTGCEKEEMSQNELRKQTEELNICLATSVDDYDISVLTALPEFDVYARHISNMFGGFTYNVESNDSFNIHVNNLCQNISGSSDPDEIITNYSDLVQMIFPTEYLYEVTNNNEQISYCINADSLALSYQNLISSINTIYPGFYEVSDEVKQQVLAKMIVERFFEGNGVGGPLEEKRDHDLAVALVEYSASIVASLTSPFFPLLFAAATYVYCSQVQSIWREYYANGGTEPKGTSCKICES